jgi:hypothetical protein
MMQREGPITCARQILIAFLAAGALIGCGSSDEAEGPPEVLELRPVETFDWGGQPIAFALPPDGWEREITNQGGLLGASFVKAGSVGEVIQIAQYMPLEKRDRCEELRRLLEDFDDMDISEFRSGMQQARLFADPPLNRQEERAVVQANETLDRAYRAFVSGDRSEAFLQLEIATIQATRIRYLLDDVVDRVLYSAKGHPPDVKVAVGEPTPATFQDRSAVRQSYVLEYGGRHYEGRRLYLMRNNRLFVAGFQGLAETVPLFEEVLATITFPQGACEH